MAYSHIAHDCIVKNHVILANAATLAGHVEIDDFAIMGGLSAVHQFTRIGCHVMASGGSMVAQDVAPYSIVQGDRATTVGLNLTGLKRRGFTREAMANIKNMYKLVFRSNMKLEEAIDKIADEFDTHADEVLTYLEFLKRANAAWRVNVLSIHLSVQKLRALLSSPFVFRDLIDVSRSA